MFKILKAWYTGLVASAKRKVVAWFRRAKPVARGRWLSGEHHESAGQLTFVPFVSPSRRYWLYLPADYRATEQLPLLVMLHGCKQDAKEFAAGTQMNALADQQRFLVLYPEQQRLANLYRCWNWFDRSSHDGHGEAAIVAGMVRALAPKHNVDATRIYVAGISAGAAIVSVLASCYADRFAACAMHSGLMFQAASSAAAAMNVMRHGSDRDPALVAQAAFDLSGHKVAGMPIVVIHGDQDRTVDPLNAEQIVAQFVALNRLMANAQNTVFDETQREENIAPNGKQYGYRVRNHGVPERPHIRAVTVHDLAHAWAGGNSSYPYNDPRGPDANELMWSFFKLHRREQAG
jgi:poly(hydroxyalkanoate) depolymerase family esterase